MRAESQEHVTGGRPTFVLLPMRVTDIAIVTLPGSNEPLRGNLRDLGLQIARTNRRVVGGVITAENALVLCTPRGWTVMKNPANPLARAIPFEDAWQIMQTLESPEARNAAIRLLGGDDTLTPEITIVPQG